MPRLRALLLGLVLGLLQPPAALPDALPDALPPAQYDWPETRGKQHRPTKTTASLTLSVSSEARSRASSWAAGSLAPGKGAPNASAIADPGSLG